MKRLQKFLVFINFGLIGCCLGHIFVTYNNYVRHPELYAMYSAPWYVDIIPTVVITAIVITITTILYFVIGFVEKKKKRDE